jgi:cephalosporin hydroxylase
MREFSRAFSPYPLAFAILDSTHNQKCIQAEISLLAGKIAERT